MGTGASSERALGPLAIAAVAEITRFDLDHLHALRQHFQLAVSPQHDHDDPEPQSISEAPVDASRRHHSVLMLPRRQEPNLSHAAFAAALESADCFFASDRAIFDRIFTLLDRTGGDEILAAEFLVGVCALLSGDLATKLQAAMELLREDGTRKPGGISGGGGAHDSVLRDELAFVLITMTLVASYFGDPPMVKRTALSIVDDVFGATANTNSKTLSPPEDEDHEASEATVDSDRFTAQSENPSLPSAEAAARLARHPLIERYIRGELAGVSSQPHA